MTADVCTTRKGRMTISSDWIRHGECNQCGDCCRQATNPVSLLVPIEDEAYGRVRYGEPVLRSGAGPPVFQIRGPVVLPCPQLDGDRCGLQATKPQYCQDTPLTPDDIEQLPRCSYYFVHRQTGEIRAASPQMHAAITFVQREVERIAKGEGMERPRGILG